MKITPSIPEIHPAALLFPMMGEEELAKLAEDIKVNGLVEPVVLYHGQVLDGRNRLEACKMAGVAPHFEEADGDVTSPTLYVLSKNLHRRHLTTSQRGAIAAEVVPMLREEAHQRQISHLKQNQSDTPSRPIDLNGGSRSTEIAAREVGVGEATVKRALEVKNNDPEMFEQIKRGEITANAAKERLTKPGHKTHRTRKEGNRGRQTGEAQKKKMIVGLSTIRGLCQGLSELNVMLAASVCTAEEINTWIKESRESAKNLRTFADKLQKGIDK